VKLSYFKKFLTNKKDFSSEIITIFETFVNLKGIKDEILLELQIIGRFFIPCVSLDRTTVSSIELSPSEVNDSIEESSSKKFSSVEEQKIAECQGRNSNVSAHMNVMMFPVPVFFKHLTFKFNKFYITTREGKESLLSFEKIKKLEMGKFSENWNIYIGKYDRSLKVKDIPQIVLEGTGEFNPVNQKDPVGYERFKLLKNIPILQVSKYKIFHPVYDPKQFYLNLISLITPRFLKTYGFPLTTFVLSYKRGGEHVYGITYNDFIKDGDYNIHPNRTLTETEVDAVYSSCKLRIRPSIMKLNKDIRLESYEKIDKIMQRWDESIKLSDMRMKVFKGIEESKKIESIGINLAFAQAVINLEGMLKEKVIPVYQSIERKAYLANKKDQETATLLFTCKPYLFFFDNFRKYLVEGLISEKLKNIVNIGYYIEVFGENLRNIVLKVTMIKKKG